MPDANTNDDGLATIELRVAKPAGLAQVQKYFSDVDPTITDKAYPMAKFRSEWSLLADKDKTNLRTGLGDGTMTY